MRSTLWSRTARPKLNGSCTSTSTSIPCRPSVIRKTTSGPIRRQITVNDVFTLLLTPILGTALLADTSWKDKRRKDWAHKIAEIEAETEQIQSRAMHSWQVLESRSLGLGATQQRRHYSAVALNLQPANEGDLPLDQPEVEHQQLPIEEWEREPTWFEATSKKAHDSADGPHELPEQQRASFTPQALERSERLRRLLAIKLALNLTIYLNTGVSPSKVRREIRIPDISPDLQYDPHGTQDLPRLLQKMRDICSMIEDLQQALPDGASPVKNETLNADSQMLQDDISSLSERYQTSSITMPEFVTSYTLAVLKSPVPPTSKAYLALFRGFARGSSGQGTSHDLAMQTLFTWEKSKLPIDNHDLFVILTELARRKHVQKFDGLMRDLTMSPSPINFVSGWTWERANGIQVPVPKSYHPALLITLIHCALRFDQPQKAEAWSEILRRTWIDVNDRSQRTPLQQLFTNWMRYYEVQGNWRRGVAWLDAAQKWAITVASFDMYSLQRLAVGMLGLCFACGKSQEYEEILNAAVDSGIPSMDPSHFLERSPRRAICIEWQHLHSKAYRRKGDPRSDHEKVQAFQSKVRAVAQRLLPEKDEADIEWRHEQENKPSPLMADPGQASSGQISTQAVALWQQIYANNQEALNSTRAAAKRWQVQHTLQEQRIRSLVSELEYQKNLVGELSGLRTQTASLNQIQNEIPKFEKTDDVEATDLPIAEQTEVVHQTSEVVEYSIAPRSQPHEDGNAVTEVVSKDNSGFPYTPTRRVYARPRVRELFVLPPSEPAMPAQYKEAEGTFSRSDFLLSHLVKPEEPYSARGQNVDMSGNPE
jgi:hypothetical protein